MIKIYIFADSHKHFSEAISEYKKRLGKKVEVIELKSIKKGTSEHMIQAESMSVQKKLQKESGYKIILSPHGNNISTQELYTDIEQQNNSGRKVIFIIGGAHGLDYQFLQHDIDFELGFGDMTFPHSLALVMLLEQIYRCQEMKKGSGYHK